MKPAHFLLYRPYPQMSLCSCRQVGIVAARHRYSDQPAPRRAEVQRRFEEHLAKVNGNTGELHKEDGDTYAV
jgi:hypothetical protein